MIPRPRPRAASAPAIGGIGKICASNDGASPSGVGGDEIDHLVWMRLLDERNERDRAKVGAAVEAAFLWSIEVVKTKGFWDWLRRQGR